MNGLPVKNILVNALGEESILSMVPCSRCLFEEDKIAVTQFDNIVEGLENYFVDYMQSEDVDQSKIETLQRTIQELRKLEIKHKENEVEIRGKENENGKTLLVCNSEIFKKKMKNFPPNGIHHALFL